MKFCSGIVIRKEVTKTMNTESKAEITHNKTAKRLSSHLTKVNTKAKDFFDY